jgi:diadenosine tetraphosphatase ApaH/serine/threonine PP2A family protein phosphatase
LEALEAVLEDIDAFHISRIYCLGDIMGYGPDPEPCREIIQNKCKNILMGNHDQAVINPRYAEKFNYHAKLALDWTLSHISPETPKFIRELPYTYEPENIFLVHASPKEPDKWPYITTLDDAMDSFGFFAQPVCFFGHTHFPLIVTSRGEVITSREYVFEKKSRYLVNVGSVGQPRDGDPRSSYVIYDEENDYLQYRRIEYNIKKCQKKMQKAELPEFLIYRLEEGR